MRFVIWRRVEVTVRVGVTVRVRVRDIRRDIRHCNVSIRNTRNARNTQSRCRCRRRLILPEALKYIIIDFRSIFTFDYTGFFVSLVLD